MLNDKNFEFKLPYVLKLLNRLDTLREQVNNFLASLQFERYLVQISPLEQVFGENRRRPEIRWRLSNLTPLQLRNQKQLRDDFSLWESEFLNIMEHLNSINESKLHDLVKILHRIIYSPHATGSPMTYDNEINNINNSIDQIRSIISAAESIENHIPYFILDTSAILEIPDINSIFSLIGESACILVIPPTLVKELEELKTGKRDENFRRNLTAAINQLNQISSKGNPLVGIEVSQGKVIRFIAKEPNFSKLPDILDKDINDDRILGTIIELQRLYPFSTITLLSNDLSMQNKARMVEIDVLRLIDK